MIIRTVGPAAVILLAAGAASADDRAVELLEAALRAHRGAERGRPPKTLLFRGSVQIRSEEKDVNHFELDQFYENRDGTETICTRLRPTGAEARESIAGFDGRRHYVVAGGRRKVIDYDKDYAEDLARVKQDLLRTRFIVDAFLVGNLTRRRELLAYGGLVSAEKLVCHRIVRRAPEPGDIETIYYVDAREGERPYFLGIEYPKTADQPKRNLCFWYQKRFGSFWLPQQMELFHDDGKRPVFSLWIEAVAVDAPPPAWLPR